MGQQTKISVSRLSGAWIGAVFPKMQDYNFLKITPC